MPTPNAVALLGLLCAVACGCRTPPEAGQSRQPAENGGASLDARVGWVHGSCLAIANGMLAADAPLVIVRPGGAAPIDDARVVGLTASDTICPALLEGRRATNAQDGWSFYEITTASAATPDLGIAVVGDVALAGDGLDMSGDGKPDTFTQCSTSEGIRFAVWSGTPYDGPALWSAYYYLGYDTAATCP